MRTMKRAAVITIIFAVLFAFAACGGPAETTKAEGEYTWGGTSFSVKKITSSDKDDGTYVFVNLEMESKGMPTNTFTQNVNNGKMLFNGQKPEDQYQYKINGSGNITSVQVTFILDSGYELNESDLIITE